MATTLCLNMIVRNEARIVERALASVRDYIDSWVICDTGSTDGTQALITDLLRRWRIPGELHQRPWIDFGHNRTEALRLAKHRADYILLMDADMVLRVDDPAFKARLDRDTYLVRHGGPLVYYNPRIVRGTLDYTYVGVTHEYLRPDAPGASEGILEGISFDDFADGSNRSTKLPRDIALLEAGLREDPANRRYQFYLAQSYFDAGDAARAIEWYSRRIEAGGWPEEVFYSRYRRAQAKLRLGVPWDEVLQDYLECVELHPHRLEPLHAAVHYCRTHNLHALGYELGCRGLTTPYPERDRLFVEKEVYDYRLLDETSVCAFYAGCHREGKQMCLALLAGGGLPVAERPRVEANLRFFAAALGEGQARPAPAASPRARKTVVFYVGYARLFDGESIAEEAYGSELALLALAAQLARSYDVYVFGSTLTDRVGHDGVRYGSSAALRAFDRPIDVLIICRYLHYFLEFEHRAAKTFIWCHDTCLHPSWEGRQLPADGKHLFRSVQHLVDGVVVLSPWHRRHFLDLYGIGDDKVFVIGNAIDPRHFDQPVAKQANKLVWTSSPSRGLRRLLAYLDEVREQIPDLTLFVYRGEGDVDSEMREQMAARPYVRYGGKQDNAVVIREYLSADLWVYPTGFHETYCTSALEAQMAGCVCVCSRLGALETTVGERGILVDPPLHDEAYDRRMIEAITRVLGSDELKREYRARGIEWARPQTWQARARQWIALFGDDVETVPAPLTSGRPAGYEVGRRQRVKLLWNWTDSATLCEVWNKMTEGDRRWDGIEITAEDEGADYYCIVNHPRPGDTYDPARTILLRMEEREAARPYFPPQWIDVDRQKLLFVFDERNSLEWHLDKTYRQLLSEPIEKSRTLSAVMSDLAALPGHRKRLEFLRYLEAHGVAFDLYGRGRSHGIASYVRELPYHRKDDGIFPYRYTIAAESVSAPGYFTEKLVDAILGECLCFYWGCPDLERHLDPEAFVRIDLDDFASAARTIARAIAEDEWTRRLGAIRREKRRILTELQVMPTLARLIAESRDRTGYHPGASPHRLNAFYEEKERHQYFHGDDHLIGLVDHVIASSGATRFVETGTYRGGTLRYLAGKFPRLEVRACEEDAFAHEMTVRNTRELPNVAVSRQGSAAFLGGLSPSPGPTVFWLDARQSLAEDVRLIVERCREYYVFIDDFEHPLSSRFAGDARASWSVIRDVLPAEARCYLPIYHERTSVYHPLVGYALVTNQRLPSGHPGVLEYSRALQNLDAFVINLDRRPDRMASFRATADGVGFRRYARHPAVDGQDLQLTDDLEALFGVADPLHFVGKRVPRHHGYNSAVLACAASHTRLWQQLVDDAGKDDHDSYLILEDDVRLAEDFVTRWYQIYARIAADPAWDFVYLGMNDDQDLYGDFYVHDEVKQFTAIRRWHGGGMYGYCIRKQGARRLLELARRFRIQQPVDHFVIDQFDGLTVYKTVPYLVEADEVWGPTGDTDIQRCQRYLKQVEHPGR